MIIRDIGIVGSGLWEGEPVTNERFAKNQVASAAVKDPYRGMRDDQGIVRVGGMEFHPERHARTIAALERSFTDPYRGTKRRRYFPPDLKVSDAEADAAQRALRDAGISSSQVDALLVQSFLPDGLQPRNSALVAHKLGITHAPAWEIDSVCNSPLLHITVGSSLMMSGFAKHVLCTQSVAYSRVMDPNVSSAVQEGDMASSLVLGPSPGTQIACSWRTDGRLHPAIGLKWGVPTGAPPRPYWSPSQERLLITFEPELQQQVMGEIADRALEVCNEALAQLEMKMSEVEVVISHQVMSWYGAFLEDVLGLRDGVLFSTFEEYANVNAASITASIHEARKAGRLKRGTKVLMFGPAAGYTFAAVAMRW